jgi:hypothetical protein
VNEVKSLVRTVKLRTPPPEPWAWRVLWVPDGATDEQVLRWAAECLDPASVAELAEILAREAADGGDAA